MKLVKYIPDTITCGNLVCGLLGVVFAFHARFDIAFPLMLAASVFDFCDGLAARSLGAYSELGKELDSLSDLVSFGVLPSVMMYNLMVVKTGSDSALCLLPLILAVCSGLRLAKFNVDDRQHENFLGLATPSAAIICGALCCYITKEPHSFLSSWADGYVFLPVLSAVLSFLLLSEIPMFSMKIKKGGDTSMNLRRIIFFAFAAICAIAVLVLGLHWSLIFVLVFVIYILLNVTFLFVK